MCGACGTIWAQAFRRWASQICPDQVSQVLEVPTTWHRMRVHCWLKGPKRLPLLQYSNSTFFGLSFSGKFLFGNSNSDLYTPDIVKNRHGCWWKKEYKCDETLHLFGKSSPPPPPPPYALFFPLFYFIMQSNTLSSSTETAWDHGKNMQMELPSIPGKWYAIKK